MMSCLSRTSNFLCFTCVLVNCNSLIDFHIIVEKITVQDVGLKIVKGTSISEKLCKVALKTQLTIDLSET